MSRPHCAKHGVVASWVSSVDVSSSFHVLLVVISLSAYCKLFWKLGMLFHFPNLSQMPKRVSKEHHVMLMNIRAEVDAVQP